MIGVDLPQTRLFYLSLKLRKSHAPRRILKNIFYICEFKPRSPRKQSSGQLCHFPSSSRDHWVCWATPADRLRHGATKTTGSGSWPCDTDRLRAPGLQLSQWNGRTTKEVKTPRPSGYTRQSLHAWLCRNRCLSPDQHGKPGEGRAHAQGTRNKHISTAGVGEWSIPV